MTSGLNFVTDGEIFRKNYYAIFANNRHLATLIPVVLSYDSAGYKPGQTIARNTTSGLWQKYNPSGASGTDTCVGVLLNEVSDMPANSKDVGQLIVKGNLFEAAVIGLDSAAKTDLGARSVVSATGDTILMF